VDGDFSCSFCGKRRREVRKLISGPRVYICDECVGACNEILSREVTQGEGRPPRPAEIASFLDQYAIGQNKAKRALAVAVYNHYKRVSQRSRPSDVEVSKGNILLIGPTGCGKTLLAQTLARRLEVPFAIADATTLTEAGYVGEDVESVIKALYRNAKGDPERTARGIACIDEVDKLARRGGGPNAGRDVSGEGVQQALLKLLEGKRASITPDGGRNRPPPELLQIDTNDILFVCCGSFNGLEEVIRRRLGDKTIGFGAAMTPARKATRSQLLAQVRPEDLIKFGMIPEFIGRLPILITCEELDESALVEILWKPRNALTKQYERLFSMEGVKLRFTEEALGAIARESIRRGAGARGLRAILEEIMLEIMYELPSLTNVRECVVNESAVVERQRPLLIREKKSA
jgi:ATP-dependent Clp protease ATP-binding subunit ClpX